MCREDAPTPTRPGVLGRHHQPAGPAVGGGMPSPLTAILTRMCDDRQIWQPSPWRPAESARTKGRPVTRREKRVKPRNGRGSPNAQPTWGGRHLSMGSRTADRPPRMAPSVIDCPSQRHGAVVQVRNILAAGTLGLGASLLAGAAEVSLVAAAADEHFVCDLADQGLAPNRGTLYAIERIVRFRAPGLDPRGGRRAWGPEGGTRGGTHPVLRHCQSGAGALMAGGPRRPAARRPVVRHRAQAGAGG